MGLPGSFGGAVPFVHTFTPAHRLHTFASCCFAAQVKYDQDGNIVLREMRDYLGALTDVERVDRNRRPLPGVSDAELAVMQVG